MAMEIDNLSEIIADGTGLLPVSENEKPQSDIVVKIHTSKNGLYFFHLDVYWEHGYIFAITDADNGIGKVRPFADGVLETDKTAVDYDNSCFSEKYRSFDKMLKDLIETLNKIRSIKNTLDFKKIEKTLYFKF